MPALEICGLVLGIIPLVISALEHYKAGKGAAAAFLKWHGQLDTLIRRLNHQRTFFYLQILELLGEAQVAQLEGGIDLTEEQCVAVLLDKQTGEEVREYLGRLHGTFVEVVSRYELCLKTIVAKIGRIGRLPDVSLAPKASLTRNCCAVFSMVLDTHFRGRADTKRRPRICTCCEQTTRWEILFSKKTELYDRKR